MAAQFGRLAVLEMLKPLVNLEQAVLAGNDAGKTPLMLACSLSAGGEEVVDFLLKAGSNPTATDLVRIHCSIYSDKHAPSMNNSESNQHSGI